MEESARKSSGSLESQTHRKPICLAMELLFLVLALLFVGGRSADDRFALDAACEHDAGQCARFGAALARKWNRSML